MCLIASRYLNNNGDYEIWDGRVGLDVDVKICDFDVCAYNVKHDKWLGNDLFPSPFWIKHFKLNSHTKVVKPPMPRPKPRDLVTRGKRDGKLRMCTRLAFFLRFCFDSSIQNMSFVHSIHDKYVKYLRS